MKRSSIYFTQCLLLSILVLGCKKNNEPTTSHISFGVSISGKVVAPNKDSKILLGKRLLPSRQFKTLDSTIPSKDGSFRFINEIREPGYYQIFYSDEQKKTSAPLLLDSGTSKVNIAIDTISIISGKNTLKTRSITIKGSKDNELLDQYFGIRKRYYQEFITPSNNKMLTNSVTAGSNERYIDSLNDLLNNFKKEMANTLSDFVLNEMGESISIYQTMNTWDENNTNLISSIKEKFKNREPESFITPHILEKANDLLNKNLIDKPYIDFSLDNHLSQSVQLKNQIGNKLVLIDFWASWCGPCIKEFPAYKELYNTNKNKEFEIISISTDTNSELWLKAIEKHNISWIKLIDNKNENVAKKYSIKFLPTNFLIDRNGIVIKKNISIPDLRSYLENEDNH